MEGNCDNYVRGIMAMARTVSSGRKSHRMFFLFLSFLNRQNPHDGCTRCHAEDRNRRIQRCRVRDMQEGHRHLHSSTIYTKSRRWEIIGFVSGEENHVDE